MSDKKFSKISDLYNEIGHELRRIAGSGSNHLYLYTEVEEGAIYGAVFKDEGNAVRYFDPSHSLCDLIMELWQTEEPDKRWMVMEYTLVGTKVDVSFRYPEELRPGEDEDERREVALKARYGDKPVIYPPSPFD